MHFEQSTLRCPDFSDPLTWATIARTQSMWLEQVLASSIVDQEVLKLGHVISMILWDDKNCFTWTLGGRFFTIEAAQGCQAMILERLNWEVGCHVLPPELQQAFHNVYALISKQDWAERDQFKTAERAWYGAREQLEMLFLKNPDLKEANEYYNQIMEMSIHHWRAFTNQSKRE